MASLTGMTIVKSFDYRDNPDEEFSSKYWFKGAVPTSSAAWDTLRSSLLALERPIYPAGVKFVRAYGYDNDASDANHVYAFDWTVPGPPPTGTLTPGAAPMAGDQAALVEWKTDHINKRGKPIYLRKYIHAGFVLSTDHDALDTAYKNALQAYADNVHALQGGLTNASSPNWPGGSHTTILNLVHPWVTTRTLKRRGPRPRTGT